MKKRDDRPRGAGRWILHRMLRNSVRETAIEDFDEELRAVSEKRGKFAASLWLWLQIAALTPSFVVDQTYWSVVMLKNYLTVTVRNIFRNKGYSFINITGLATGLACCTLILLWVQDELSYDRFHENIDDIYRVVQDITFSDHSTTWGITQGPLGPSLEQDFPEIVLAARFKFDRERIKIGDQKFSELGAYADQSFLGIFTYPFVHGDKSTALLEPDAVVLSETLAEKLFGAENPVGKTLVFNEQYEKRVTGVFKDVPHNSTLQFEFLGQLEFTREYGYTVDSWGNSTFSTFVLLPHGLSREDVAGKISGHLLDKPTLEKNALLNLQPYKDIYLKSGLDYDFGGLGDMQYVYIFSIIAIFILLIACINFMNLATARSGSRAKEIGVRKVSGACRMHIISQFFGESAIMSFIAMAMGAALVVAFINPFNELAGKQLTFNPFINMELGAGLLLIAILTAVLSGSYPALFLSSFEPVKVLKGAATVTRGAMFRKALVITQFAITITLVVCTAVVYFQLDYLRNKKLGYKKDNMLYVSMTPQITQDYNTIREELLRNPNIQKVTAMSNLPTSGFWFSNSRWEWEGMEPGTELLIRGVYVDIDYVDAFDMEIVDGRAFSKDMATDTIKSFIVNETAVKAMGIEKPVGKLLGRGDLMVPIIGVVKDYNYRSLRSPVEPLVLIPTKSYLTTMCMSVSMENVAETVSYVEGIWKQFEPERAFSYGFLDERLDAMYRSEERIGTIFRYFSVLAILISCLGLFGLASFLAEQRTKEIGIRKVLGASVPGIIVLLSKEFSKWVLIANVIAWPAAWYFMNRWLEDFAYRTDFGLTVFVLSGLLAFFISILTVSYQTIRAARSNPVDSLKYE